MSVVAKMFVQVQTIDPDGAAAFQLSAVCRGELNKDWAAATPAGTAKLSDPTLDAVWAAKQAGERADAEVYVELIPDPDGDWKMESCSFSYGGCAVMFRRQGPPWGQELAMTVNATSATASLRRTFAEGLVAGHAPKFRIAVAEAEHGAA